MTFLTKGQLPSFMNYLLRTRADYGKCKGEEDDPDYCPAVPRESMNTKEALIKLGSENPELQKHIRPVIDKISSVAIQASGNTLQDIQINASKAYLKTVAAGVVDDLNKEDHFRVKAKGNTVAGRGWSVDLRLNSITSDDKAIFTIMESRMYGSDTKTYSKHESASRLAWKITNDIKEWLS